jgi:hypothetical protein
LENNLNRADAVLNRVDPDSLDLLVLPELAFSGTYSLVYTIAGRAYAVQGTLNFNGRL